MMDEPIALTNPWIKQPTSIVWKDIRWNNRFIQKWQWAICQTVVVMLLLSGGGSGSGGENNTGATICANDTEVTSGDASAAIALSEGDNTISLVVTAEDGVTTQYYSIEISRADASSFAQQAYLKASNADAYDYFGTNAAISGILIRTGLN
jgi:hypothetical protein